MNVLPKNYSEFLSKDYWTNFYKGLQAKSKDLEYFEWYGEYPSYRAYINNLLAKESKILNMGCGKSLFSEKMYDEGYKQIVNIDISEWIVKEMAKRSKLKRPQMSYKVMDVMNMSFEEGSFDAVIEKGTLDAIYPENTEEITKNVEKVFDDVMKILKENGSYIFISLLQDFILDKVLERFLKEGYGIDVHRACDFEGMPPFLVRVQKGATHCKIHYSPDESQDVAKSELKSAIQNIQLESNNKERSRNIQPGQRFTLHVYDKSNTSVPKYTFSIVDSPAKKIAKKRSCAVFLIPQGREGSYLYATEKGNFALLEQTQMSRLIIVSLNAGFSHGKLTEVQSELSPLICTLQPENCINTPCPFFTDGDDLGEKLILFQDKELIIEECKDDEDQYFRRLVFTSNVNQIQSQFRLRYTKLDEGEPEQTSDDSLMPLKKGYRAGIDAGYLDFEFYRYMVSGLALLPNWTEREQPLGLTVLGGGVGSYPNFIEAHFKNVKVKTVEISKEVIEISKKFFECGKNSVEIIHDDAYKYIVSKASQIEANPEDSTLKEDYIVVSISTGNLDEVSPPKPFLEWEFLGSVKKCLRTGGVMCINYISKSKKELEKLIADLSKEFHIVYSVQMETEDNSLVFAVNTQFEYKTSINCHNQEEQILIVDEEKIRTKTGLEESFAELYKSTKSKWDVTMNIQQLLTNFVLQHPKHKSNPFEKKKIATMNEDEMSNNTKEMYLKDYSKVNKKQQQRKKKNKGRH